MRDEFPEYYRADATAEEHFVKTAVVVPDTNVLLDLYRLTTTERNQVLDALTSVRDRLWIPYQVGLEYQRNRMAVIQKQASSYQRLVDIAGPTTKEKLQEDLDRLADLPEEVRDEAAERMKGLAERLADATTAWRQYAEEVVGQHVVTREQGLGADPVRRRLDQLFAGRVGAKPSDDEHTKRVKTGVERSTKKIPPGYKDQQKDTDEQKAGDYLVWSQLLDHAASTANGSDFLFVTSDVKEDWFERWGGEPTGPLPALIAEFKTRTTADYHQVTLADFLRLTNDHLSTEVAERTIEKTNTLRVTVPSIGVSNASLAWRNLQDVLSRAENETLSRLKTDPNLLQDYLKSSNFGEVDFTRIPNDENYRLMLRRRLNSPDSEALANDENSGDDMGDDLFSQA